MTDVTIYAAPLPEGPERTNMIPRLFIFILLCVVKLSQVDIRNPLRYLLITK